MNLAKQYVCVDTETTGLNDNLDEIVEVYARRFKEDGSLGKEFHQFCRPRNNYIPAQATAIHGITFDQVKDCPNYLQDGVQQALAQFIGDRKAIGHNLIGFDIKFLKITPVEMEDTLIICRDRYGMGRNNLKQACKRAGIPFDPSKAHGASYDVDRTIQLYLKLKNFPSLNVQEDLFNTQSPVEVKTAIAEPQLLKFEKAKEEVIEDAVITPIEKPVTPVIDIKSIFTQAFSYSRIDLFHQCPFKWYKRYVEKVYEPDNAALITGGICHQVAQNTSLWCYRETFANKFNAYAFLSKFEITKELAIDAQAYYDVADPTPKEIGYYLFENPKGIQHYTGSKGLSHFITEMDEKIGDAEYEKVSMPDLDTYSKLINEALRLKRVSDPDIIRDVEKIMMKFYGSKDFSNRFGQIALVEKKLAFDKDWKYVPDWKSDSIFFRGIIDVIEYYPEYILITDYKTSRTMLNLEQLKRDMQLKVYLLLLFKFLPAGSIKRVIVSIEYLRYGQHVEYEVPDVEQMAKEANQWIYDSIMDIEQELAKDSNNAFKPRRNEYCNCCYLAEGNICPLYNRKHINNIENIETFQIQSSQDCVTAWKRIEVNKNEIKNLTEKCKTYIKANNLSVTIDETAKLDFYPKKVKEYDVEKVVPLLLAKGLKLKDMLYYLGISPTNIEKLLTKNKLELTEEETNQISHLKIRNEFDAYTEEEAKSNDCLNA